MKLIKRSGHGRHEEFIRISKVVSGSSVLSLTKSYSFPELVRLRQDFYTTTHAAFINIDALQTLVMRRKMFRGSWRYKFVGILINE